MTPAGKPIGFGKRGNMSADRLAERIEAVEQRLRSLREHAQATPEQQPLLDTAAEDLGLALDGLRAARDELQHQEQREQLLAQMADDRQSVEDLARSLEQERHLLETIMGNTPAQLAYLDPEFNFVRVNAAYAEGSGHSKQELIGRNHFDLFPNAENQAIFEGVRDIGQPVAYQARPFEYADQPERGITYWDWTLVPVKSEAGKTQGLVISLRDVTERRRHLAQLEIEQARLRAVIDNAPEAIVVVDEESRIVLANPAAERLCAGPLPYGQGFESHADLALCEPNGTPYDPRQLPLTRSALDGQASRNVEMAVCWPGGEQRDLLFSSAPIQDRQGCVTGAVGVFQDITELRRTQRALQRYVERLRILHEIDQAILVAQSAEGIAEAALDHVQQLVPCQHASVLLFDLEKHEASLLAARAAGEMRLAKGWRSSIGSEWPIEKLAQGQIHVVEEARDLPPPSPLLQTLQGEGLRSYINVPLLVHGTLLGSLNLGMAGPGSPGAEELEIAREIAAQLAVGIQQAHLHQQVQRHAEELEQRVARRTAALQASQARLRAIFDGAAIGIALADAEGHILESNPVLQAMLAYSAGELREMVFTDFTHPEDAATDLNLYRELVAGKRERYSLDKRYMRKDGQVIWARLTVSLVRTSEGEVLFAIAMVEDITEQKKLRDALLNAEKLAIAGQLGASLAHEINNPLQSVIGCLGLADKNLAAGADVSRYLRVAREELRRTAGIVAQFRDLHRLSEPKDRRPADLNALLEQVLLLCKKKCEECRIRVRWKGADDLPPVPLGSDQMKQVFLNLILNALDATPEGGWLEVSTCPTIEPTGVCISFADSGLGIAPEVLPHVFDPFYSTKAQGLGLGLYTSSNIVEAHGGHIDVSSHLGEGATFSVWLPA
jgi:PAS domain S-box-containing protein